MQVCYFPFKKIVTFIAFIFVIISATACSQKKSVGNDTKTEKSFQNSFMDFQTHLTEKKKAPQEFFGLPEKMINMDIIYYESDSIKLKAFLWNKNIDSNKRKPALVYFHGGFSVDYSELYICKKFIDNGFIVLTPTYRREIDNPGYFEFFLGEVKDAKEAVKWLAKQPYVDTNRIFTFGHSIGGGISLMLSFHDDLPIKIGGSSSGLYDESSMSSWNSSGIIMPFDITNQEERNMRLPIKYLNLMKRKHYMFCGFDDEYTQEVKDITQKAYINKSINLEFINVSGDHFTSLNNSLNEFYKLIQITNK